MMGLKPAGHLVIEENRNLEIAGSTRVLNVPHRKYAITMVWSGFTPASAGPDLAELPVPLRPDGVAAIWRICRVTLHVAVAGGTPSIALEYCRTQDADVWEAVADVIIPSNHKTAVGLSHSTIQSGGFLRFNVLILAGSNWTVNVDLEEAA